MKTLRLFTLVLAAAAVMSCDSLKETKVTLNLDQSIEVRVPDATVGAPQETSLFSKTKGGGSVGDQTVTGSFTLDATDFFSAYTEYLSFVQKVSAGTLDVTAIADFNGDGTINASDLPTDAEISYLELEVNSLKYVADDERGLTTPYTFSGAYPDTPALLAYLNDVSKLVLNSTTPTAVNGTLKATVKGFPTGDSTTFLFTLSNVQVTVSKPKE